MVSTKLTLLDGSSSIMLTLRPHPTLPGLNCTAHVAYIVLDAFASLIWYGTIFVSPLAKDNPLYLETHALRNVGNPPIIMHPRGYNV